MVVAVGAGTVTFELAVQCNALTKLNVVPVIASSIPKTGSLPVTVAKSVNTILNVNVPLLATVAKIRHSFGVYKLELKTHKLTKFIETDVNKDVYCMDILESHL